METKQRASYQSREELHIEGHLCEFIEEQLLPARNIDPLDFYQALTILLEEFGPANRQLLCQRKRFQHQIDQFHDNAQTYDPKEYRSFLEDIGYITPVKQEKVCTMNVDDEIATKAAPQLVVPIKNARFAINAINARWGSLYDALYSSDMIEEKSQEDVVGYDPIRGNAVIHWGRCFLNDTFALTQGSFDEVVRFCISEQQLCIALEDGQTVKLLECDQFIGYRGDAKAPTNLILKHNDLLVDIEVDNQHPIGRIDKAGIKDVRLESALTSILDMEDSVAAVDGEDKAEVYRNLLEIYDGTLSAKVTKGNHSFERTLAEDIGFIKANGESGYLKARGLFLVRNTGIHMMTSAVLDDACCEVPEGILDGLITAISGMKEVRKSEDLLTVNSVKNSIYIVKPKLQGPEEVAFCVNLFDRIETLLGLAKNTVKLGIMDEEHRTTLNLTSCISEAKERVIFINTGFLDRTASEIHVNRLAGPMLPKAQLKTANWLKTYEKHNVSVGLNASLPGKGQIGKGMWAEPDRLNDLYATKSQQLKAGASCAWVPSPTAAIIHAIHYHQVEVKNVQQQASLLNCDNDGMFDLPLLLQPLDQDVLVKELMQNAQSILGYVGKWINQGIGCSKVLDWRNVGLMEDRATLRISAQLLSNWLSHGICSKEQLLDAFAAMAEVVDEQNEQEVHYETLSINKADNLAYQTALSLVFDADTVAGGFTEEILHKFRLAKKLAQRRSMTEAANSEQDTSLTPSKCLAKS